MRTNIVHPGADELSYEIRAIVEVARKLEKLVRPITWENIGDPVAKGEKVPEWIKEIVSQAALQDQTYAYSPTKGLLATREYIAQKRNEESTIGLTADDILFCNGLGDAISKIYQNLHPDARVIGPSPAYPTHSSAEAAHSGKPHLTYSLDPEKGWQPNLHELEQKIVENENIAAILIINPDNPTGYVYKPDVIEQMVDIARRHNLFIISDEIYSNLFFPESGMQKLATAVDGVPAIAMRGISKEFPWPGARCGWLEFYNRHQDAKFDRYVQSIIDSKMLEVCSTTLPQSVIPIVMEDERYFPYLAERTKLYQKYSQLAVEILGEIPELIINPAEGAFYMTAVFKDGVLRDDASLAVDDERALAVIEPLLSKAGLDQRFVYYLLAATGICIVPLSTGFNSTYNGFRFTLLEPSEEKFKENLLTIRDAIQEYIK